MASGERTEKFTSGISIQRGDRGEIAFIAHEINIALTIDLFHAGDAKVGASSQAHLLRFTLSSHHNNTISILKGKSKARWFLRQLGTNVQPF